MFSKVLFATDLSIYSSASLECVSEMPGVREVILLNVIDATHPSKRGWVYDDAIKNSEKELENQKKHLLLSGIDARVRVEVITTGEVAETIVRVAKEEDVSLIVTGARGKGLVSRVLLGSVSKGVLQGTRGGVLIIRNRVVELPKGPKYEKLCPGIFSKILFPTDFSDHASAVVPILEGIEGLGKVILLHVVTRGETKEEIDISMETAQQRLEAIAEGLKRAGKEAEVVVHLGSPTDEIIHLAENEDVSLIVMGRHGHGRVREMVLGSTAYMVAKRAKRPVLIAGQSS
jgi:nucleotide-binding universal stress UspA family protein